MADTGSAPRSLRSIAEKGVSTSAPSGICWSCGLPSGMCSCPAHSASDDNGGFAITGSPGAPPQKVPFKLHAGGK